MKRRVTLFVFVGALGFVLQIASLWWLTRWMLCPYPLATVIAVELAVLHNFWWHERWTWRDLTIAESGAVSRLTRFHVSTGLTSIVGNLVITSASVELLAVNAIAANASAVAIMSLANFLIADRWVFVEGDYRASARH